MQREKDCIFFTEEDKKNMVIKKHTESAMEEKLGAYKKKRNRRRIIYAVIFAVAIAATCAEWDWMVYWAYIAICGMIFLTLIYEYINRVDLKTLSQGLYYIEVFVEKKLPREHFAIPAFQQGSFLYFYPVEGRDSTSGYRSIFYVEQEQYAETDVGGKIKISLMKDFAERVIAKQNCRQDIGG